MFGIIVYTLNDVDYPVYRKDAVHSLVAGLIDDFHFQTQYECCKLELAPKNVDRS